MAKLALAATNSIEDDFWKDDAPITPKTCWISLNQVALICAVVGFLLYINTIWTCGFCFDDAVAIIANPDVLSSKKELAPSTNVLQVFEHDFWGLPVSDVRSNKSYRPIAVLSLRMDAFIARILGMPGEPAVFHLFNAILYSLTCWVLVKYMLTPIITSSTTSLAFSQDGNVEISILLSGLWFVTHPVHTESVAGLVGRADVLAALFSILGTKFHFEHKTIACALCLIMAFLCKETSVMIPMVLGVADVLQLLTSSRCPSKRDTEMASIPGQRRYCWWFFLLDIFSFDRGSLRNIKLSWRESN